MNAAAITGLAKALPWPVDDPRVGTPLVENLRFLELEKQL